MICDKCGKKVGLRNNALLYDAALSALIGNRPVPAQSGTHVDLNGKVTAWQIHECGYNPKTNFVIPLDVFGKGDIVYGNPSQSIANVNRNHTNGRHLYETKTCEGSP